MFAVYIMYSCIWSSLFLTILSFLCSGNRMQEADLFQLLITILSLFAQTRMLTLMRVKTRLADLPLTHSPRN